MPFVAKFFFSDIDEKLLTFQTVTGNFFFEMSTLRHDRVINKKASLMGLQKYFPQLPCQPNVHNMSGASSEYPSIYDNNRKQTYFTNVA